MEGETIVAVATPPGRGGIGIVRLSGAGAVRIVAPLVRLRGEMAAGRARFGEVIDRATGDVLDEAVVTYFAGPRSYTGEDVVEVAVHGAPVLLEYLLRACCAGGARLAGPGEFTERAFLAGRLDLTQAEAVGDLIEAVTLEQARVAARQLGGGLSRVARPAKERLVALIAEMEAGIDFAEDDIAVMGDGAILQAVAEVEQPLARLAASFAYGRLVRDGFQMALVGRPNAGKSSLFNRLLERERAIVTASPGTTRDVVTERMSINGVPVELVDTAGLRVGVEEAEVLGIARSREAMAEAAVVVLVVDGGQELGEEDWAVLRGGLARVVVAVNKVDLGEPLVAALEGFEVVRTSAVTGEGVAALKAAIVGAVPSDGGSAMVTNLRQREAIAGAQAGLAAARAAVAARVPHEMVLLDLYAGLRGMDALTGETTAEDVLRLIFGRFCIGK